MIWTRESLLRAVGFNPADEFRRSHKVIRKAHKSDNEAIALKAAELNLKLADAFPDAKRESPDPGRPIAVNIVLTGSNAPHQIAVSDEPFTLRALPPVVDQRESA